MDLHPFGEAHAGDAGMFECIRHRSASVVPLCSGRVAFRGARTSASHN